MELAESESRELYNCVVEARARASAAEGELSQSRALLQEYRDREEKLVSKELKSIKDEWKPAGGHDKERTASFWSGCVELQRIEGIRLKLMSQERSKWIEQTESMRATINTAKERK